MAITNKVELNTTYKILAWVHDEAHPIRELSIFVFFGVIALFAIFHLSHLASNVPTPSDIDLEFLNISQIDFIKAVTWLYMAINTGRLIAYMPQIRSAIRCQDGARSVSIPTWSYFCLSWGVGSLYSQFVLKDFNTTLLFTTNFISCVVLVSILVWKRKTYRKTLDENIDSE